ncbi:MAG: hypothetical protein HKN79_06500 [Flavobacteriales bacterium]|nr:hypothetical protein [Flavobacteriales bacterium]
MDPASIKVIKDELKDKSPAELTELVLALARSRKENKELLSYLLFDSYDEEGYIRAIKEEIEEEFSRINDRNFYYIKKSVRKILRNTKKYIRYSKKKETEVEVLLHFCKTLADMTPSYKRNIALSNLMDRQFALIYRTIGKLHPDLQYDYRTELEEITDRVQHPG